MKLCFVIASILLGNGVVLPTKIFAAEHFGKSATVIVGVFPEWSKWMLIFGGIFIALVIICLMMFRKMVYRRTVRLTERTRSLAASEKKYRLLFETATDAIMLMREDKFVDCNAVALELFGCSVEMIIGYTPYGLSSTEQPNGRNSKIAFQSLIMKTLLHNSQSFEWEFKKADNNFFNAEVSLNMIELEDGKYIQAIIRDITERKVTEEALIYSENKFRTLVKALPDMTFVLSKDYIVLDYTMVENQLKTSGDKLLMGNTIDALGFTDSGFEKIKKAIEQTLSEYCVVSLELSQGDFNDDIYWEMRFSPAGDDKVVAVLRDISQRMESIQSLKSKNDQYIALNEKYLSQNEELRVTNEELSSTNKKLMAVLEDLKISEKRQAMVVHSLPMAFYVARPEKVTQLTWISEQIDKVSGYTADEFISNKYLWESRMHPDDRSKVEEAFGNISQTDSVEVEYRWKNSAGIYLWLLDQAVLIRDKKGEPTEILGTWLDITERKMTELKLKLTNKEYAALNEAYHTQNERLRETNVELADSHEKLKKVNLELLESEGRYKTLSNLTIEGIVIHKNGRVVDLNESYARIFGYKRDELIGKDISTLLADEESMRKLGEIIKTGSSVPFELAGLTKTGEQFPLEIESRSVFYKGEEVSVASARNIIERVKAEKALRESEENFRQLAENINDMFVLRSADNEVLYVSPSFEKIIGRKPEILINNPWASFKWYHPEDRQKMLDLSREVSKTGKHNLDVRHRIVRPDGEVRWLWSRGHPIFDDEGKLRRLVTISSDITDQVLAEEERTRLAVAVEQLSEIIIITNTDFLVEYVNPAFEKITGYDKIEMLEKSPFTITQEQFDLENDLRYVIEVDRQWSGRIVNLKKNGTTFTQSTTITALKNEIGVVINYVFVGHDISEELRLQERLRQSQKLEAMGTLAGGIAHDFNNLLTPIQGYSQLLKDEIEKKSQAYSDLEQILAASKRAKELVDQILTFSRKVDVDFKTFEIAPIVNEAMKLLRSSIPASIEIRQELDKSKSYISGDPTQLHQVLINLGTNAFHAMEEKGGTLDVKVSKLFPDEEFLRDHPRLSPDNWFVRITIGDNGIGMDKELVDRIFEPFFTTKPKGKGTGLGLSIVHGIVASMDGDISVYSEPGRGTTFNVYLPLSGKQKISKKENVLEAPKGNNEIILLVDDEEAVLKYGLRVLKKLGYVVIPFSESFDALEYLINIQNKVDLIVTDFTMPRLNGMQLAQEAKKVRPELPVILISGLIRSLTDDEFAESGIDRFIAKPFTQEELGREIHRFLASSE